MQRLTVAETAAVLAVLAGSLALAVALGAGACTVRPGQPDLVGQDIRLTIIRTADMHARLFPYNFVPSTFDRGDGLITAGAIEDLDPAARVGKMLPRVVGILPPSSSTRSTSGSAFRGRRPT